MASKPVKLQRPGKGHRVQSLRERTWPPTLIKFSQSPRQKDIGLIR
jgi:hypothetical protein